MSPYRPTVRKGEARIVKGRDGTNSRPAQHAHELALHNLYLLTLHTALPRMEAPMFALAVIGILAWAVCVPLGFGRLLTWLVDLISMED